jgi:tetratricopeptide (TPR) repeat protein
MKSVGEVVAEGLALCEAKLAADTGGRGPAIGNIYVTEWVNTLESIRRDQGPDSSGLNALHGQAHGVVANANSVSYQEPQDDDLDKDLAKAALDAGGEAFEARDWEEAERFLQDALRLLEQLPQHQRAFCDIFTLHYKLAVCTFHTGAPMDAKGVLLGLASQQASSDEHRGYVLDARHLLACLYIRLGQIDLAKSECESILHARRLLFGKHSDAALQSTALMAQIYILLNNTIRARAYQGMMPLERREAILKSVEDLVGMKIEPLDCSPRTLSPQSACSDIAVGFIPGRHSLPIHVPMSFVPQSPVVDLQQPVSFQQATAYLQQPPSFQQPSLQQPIFQQSLTASLQKPPNFQQSAASFQQPSQPEYADSVPRTQPATPVPEERAALNPDESPEGTFKDKPLSRKEVLDNIGCHPQDRIEKAVCRGDRSALDGLIQSKRKFWRIKFHTTDAPERITALHFAALFGEIDMAQRLLISGYNINAVPFGYTSRHTALKFAIGARQVDMVRFLVANGAKPSKPDSWSTMAAQPMNRSWLKTTMSELEREYLPGRIIAIFTILLGQRWNINEPFEESGNNVLHQAVTFWTGSLKWDQELRTAITSFLCNHGADPFRANAEGKTPYSIAAASDETLLQILRQRRNMQVPGHAVDLVELPSLPC